MTRELLARLLALFGRRRSDAQLGDEIRAHLDLLAEDFARGGMAPHEARAAARREFGGVEQIKEQYRDQRGWALVDALGQDVRYALRTFAKNRSFAAVAILTFAIGIGANTAIFALVDSLFLRWLPVREPQQLVQLKILRHDAPPGESFSYLLTRGLSDQTTDLFSGLFGSGTTSFTVGPPETPARARGAWVTGAYYDTLGVRALRGRLLNRADDQPGAAPAAVITEGYWQRAFGRDPQIAGRTMVIEGVRVPIVGVSSGPFGGVDVGDVADITLAIAAVPRIVPDQSPLLDTSTTWLHSLARPRDGVSRSLAEARLAIVWPRIADQVVAASDDGTRRRVIGTRLEVINGGTGWTFLRDQFEDPVLVLLVLVGLVHLIACANVANLLLARAAARRREIAIRLAIGAGRGRIVRQMLVESLLLALAGAAAGAVLASFIERFLVDLISSGRRTPLMIDVTPHWHVLTFTIATAAATGIIFGLAPAWRATRLSPASALTTGTRVVARGRRRLASGLVVAEVALSLLMLVGAGLFVQTLRNLRLLDAGIRRDGVLLVELDSSRSSNGPQLAALSDELARDVARLPGVTTTSMSLMTPLVGGGINQPVKLDGQPLGGPSPYFNAIGPQYFATLGTRVLEGREFAAGDTAGALGVAIVNQAFVRRYLEGHEPLGQRLTVRILPSEAVIVGVVQDAVYESLREPPPPTVYAPLAQAVGTKRVGTGITMLVGVDGEITWAATALQQTLQPRFPGAPVRVRTLSAQIERSLIRERLLATLAGSLGIVALILAAVGLFGLLAYTVESRTNEIGVRMALGAARGQVMSLVIGDAVRLMAIGAVLGIPAAWATSRLISSLLFGLKGTDPGTLAGAASLLLLTGLLAAVLPALRASRVDPMVALRHD
jgi:predicted permease